LVGRDAELEVGAPCLVRMHAGEERGRRARVVAAAVAERPALVLRKAAEDVEVVPVRFEHLQRRAELEALAGGPGRPEERPGARGARANGAVRLVHVAEPYGPRACAVGDRREGRQHRVEERQGHRSPHPMKKRPAWQWFVKGVHGPVTLRIWNGMLSTTLEINDEKR